MIIFKKCVGFKKNNDEKCFLILDGCCFLKSMPGLSIPDYSSLAPSSQCDCKHVLTQYKFVLSLKGRYHHVHMSILML